MNASRRLLAVAIGLAFAGSAVMACGDDDTNDGGGSLPDASTSNDARADSAPNTLDGSSNGDSGGNDAGKDTGVDSGSDAGADSGDAGVDAGPTTTETLSSTALIRVGELDAYAEFYEDDLVIRWSNAPGCHALVRSPTKPRSTADEVQIGGEIVGKTGGPAAPVLLDQFNDYYVEDTMFPASDQYTLDIQHGETAAFPELAITTLRPSLAGTIPITKPAAPDPGEDLSIPSTTDLEVEWTVPATGTFTDQRILANLYLFAGLSNGSKNVELFCSFPTASGKATIPANVLKDVRDRAGGAGTSGTFNVYAGGFKVVDVDNAVYTLIAARSDAADFPPGQSVDMP